MCGNARVTGSHQSTPNGRLDIQISSSIARVCLRRRKPLITGENHTSQPPVAILNAAAVIANRLSSTIIPGPADESQQQSGSGGRSVLLPSIVTETERSGRRCLRVPTIT